MSETTSGGEAATHQSKGLTEEASNAMGIGDNGEKSTNGKFIISQNVLLWVGGLLVTLLGSVFGLWYSGTQQTAENNRASNVDQWRHISELEAGVSKISGTVEGHTKAIEEDRQRILYLERARR